MDDGALDDLLQRIDAMEKQCMWFHHQLERIECLLRKLRESHGKG